MDDMESEIWATSPMSGARSRFLFRHTVLGHHVAEYYLDESIGYIFVKSPHWLDEAYSDAIAITDTGCLARNRRNVEIVSRALAIAGRAPRGVDLGGGYGLFVRGMRDAGYDFSWTDKYATNLFAIGFEAAPGAYPCAAAFEVLEHLENPLVFLEDAKRTYQSDLIFVSATLFDPTRPPDLEWWYWAFETGQHISFFSCQSLEWMAQRLGMQLVHIRDDVYVFSSHAWGKPGYGAAEELWRRVRKRIDCSLQMDGSRGQASLTFTDHIRMRDHVAKRHRAR